MTTRDDGLRSEIADLLLDAEHRDELRRVGVWAFEHVAKSEATGQIAAVLNAVASAASTEWIWRAVNLEAASNDELKSLAIMASVLRGETEWSQVDGVLTATAENSSPWSRRPGGFRRSTPTLDARCSRRTGPPDYRPGGPALNRAW